MGATLDLFLEYDDSVQKPFSGDIDGVIDFTKSRNIVYGKHYSLMQAIAGVRGKTEIKPKFNSRGFPKYMNDLVQKYFEEFYGLDYPCAGWLHYSEFMECLEEAEINRSELKTPILQFIEIFKNLKEEYGEERTRMIFAIGSP